MGHVIKPFFHIWELVLWHNWINHFFVFPIGHASSDIMYFELVRIFKRFPSHSSARGFRARLTALTRPPTLWDDWVSYWSMYWIHRSYQSINGLDHTVGPCFGPPGFTSKWTGWGFEAGYNSSHLCLGNEPTASWRRRDRLEVTFWGHTRGSLSTT
jgi:hypothetical protein